MRPRLRRFALRFEFIQADIAAALALATSGMMRPFPCAIFLAYSICAGLTGLEPSFPGVSLTVFLGACSLEKFSADRYRRLVAQRRLDALLPDETVGQSASSQAGPAKPAGIEPGDVVVKFDGRDVREMHDLPRIVADTAVGKEVDVVVIRKGKEETHRVKIGRLEDGEKAAAANPDKDSAQPPKTAVQKTLGLELSSLSDDLRKKYKVRDNVKGVIITAVDPSVANRQPIAVAHDEVGVVGLFGCPRRRV